MSDRTLCGIVRVDTKDPRTNGTDCSNPAEPSAVLNLCREHLAAAYLWVCAAQEMAGSDADIPALPTPRCSLHPPLVYYLAFSDRIKIGTTVNLGRRMLQVPCDGLLATEPGGYAVERTRHAQFESARLRGGQRREWFSRTPALLAHIVALRIAV